jgi:O-antigen ligase
LALPRIAQFVPGLGVVENLFSIDYQRLLALCVLLPAYLVIRIQPGSQPFGRLTADKLLLGYLVLSASLMLAYTSISITLRNGVFNAFVDVFLPYYVASRLLTTVERFRDALTAFVIGALVLSAILMFEFAKKWLLFSSLDEALGVHWGWITYQARASNLRATGPIGHPVAAGYAVAVGWGLFLYVRTLLPGWAKALALLLLTAGLVAPLSRGSWVGAAAMLVVFVAMGPALNFVKLAAVALVGIPLLLISPLGSSIIEYLPFVGSIEANTVIFRQRMAEASLQVILDNPVFGRYDYLETPAMEALRGTDGLIDTVNTYAVVGLGSGLVGLSLFGGFFLLVIARLYKCLRNCADKTTERYILGQALLATLVGILVIIGTLAPVLCIPTIYWCIAGVGVAYTRLVSSESRVAAFAPTPALAAAVRGRRLGRAA